jgi:hypothetical protein
MAMRKSRDRKRIPDIAKGCRKNDLLFMFNKESYWLWLHNKNYAIRRE